LATSVDGVHVGAGDERRGGEYARPVGTSSLFDTAVEGRHRQLAHESWMRIGRMRHEPVGTATGQLDRAAVHAAEKDRRRVMRQRAGIEEWLQAVEGVGRGAHVQGRAFGERSPDGAHDRDVILHASQRITPRNAESTLDVLTNLRGQSQIEATRTGGRRIPCLERQQHRATGEGQGEAGLDPQPIGGHERQQRHRHRVVNGLGYVQDVESHRLDSLGVRPHLGQGNAVAHPRDQKHGAILTDAIR